MGEQEPKYMFDVGRVINRASGEVIPADEPVFIFRARDRHAAEVLRVYAAMVSEDEHYAAVSARIEDFERFAANYPERMKEPDTDLQEPRHVP